MRTVQEVLTQSSTQIEALATCISKLRSLDRAEYPDAAVDLAGTAMRAAESIRCDMSSLYGRFGGQVLRRRRKAGL